MSGPARGPDEGELNELVPVGKEVQPYAIVLALDCSAAIVTGEPLLITSLHLDRYLGSPTKPCDKDAHFM